MLDFSDFSLRDILQLTPEECREHLAAVRWPDGPVCPWCGEGNPYRIVWRAGSRNLVAQLFKCRGCQRQFSATVGTIFEDSKIPLNKWFAAIYLMCTREKGITAHRMHWMVRIGYGSALFVCQRIQAAVDPEADDGTE